MGVVDIGSVESEGPFGEKERERERGAVVVNFKFAIVNL